MKGFFTKQEVTNTSRSSSKPLSCVSCKLYRGKRNPKIKPYGNFKKHIMIIGDVPGSAEDRTGIPFSSGYGRRLKSELEKLGIDLKEDCVSLYAINCAPNSDEKVDARNIACCREVFVTKAIKEYVPEVIILLGTFAVQSFLGHRWKKDLGGIARWRGWTIPDRDYKAWVCPIFDPKYVITMEDDAVMTVWRQDLKRAISKVGKKLPRYKAPKIHYITDLSVLDKIPQGLVSFDYEATGLKPHAKGHRIVCASVTINKDEVYVFPIPKKRSERAPLIRLLKSSSHDKVAANMRYEDTWTKVRLGREAVVINWGFDIILAAHLLDNRPGIVGLKFQTYVLLGICDYDSEVSDYLKSDSDNANDLNKIDKLIEKPDGMKTLMRYCGLDSIYTLRIALLQIEELGYNWLPF